MRPIRGFKSGMKSGLSRNLLKGHLVDVDGGPTALDQGKSDLGKENLAGNLNFYSAK